MPSGAFAPPPDLARQHPNLPGPPPSGAAPLSRHEAYPGRDSSKRSPDRRDLRDAGNKLPKRGDFSRQGSGDDDQVQRGDLRRAAEHFGRPAPARQAPEDRYNGHRPEHSRRRSRTNVLLIKVSISCSCIPGSLCHVWPFVGVMQNEMCPCRTLSVAQLLVMRCPQLGSADHRSKAGHLHCRASQRHGERTMFGNGPQVCALVSALPVSPCASCQSCCCHHVYTGRVFIGRAQHSRLQMLETYVPGLGSTCARKADPLTSTLTRPNGWHLWRLDSLPPVHRHAS